MNRSPLSFFRSDAHETFFSLSPDLNSPVPSHHSGKEPQLRELGILLAEGILIALFAFILVRLKVPQMIEKCFGVLPENKENQDNAKRIEEPNLELGDKNNLIDQSQPTTSYGAINTGKGS